MDETDNKIELAPQPSVTGVPPSTIDLASVPPILATERYRGQQKIVSHVVYWCFIIGSAMTVVFLVRDFIPHNPPYNFAIQDLTTIWSSFMSLITLSIGYLFGKYDR